MDASALSLGVRPGEWADLEGVLEVYNHYVRSSSATFELAPVGAEERAPWMREHLGGGRHRLFVGIDDRGRVAGWATTSAFRPRAAYSTTVESSIYVRPGLEGRGLGFRLYSALFESIQGEDIERIVAGMTVPNPASLALHLRMGFSRVGTFSRVGRKFGRFWDVSWFERPLRLGRAEDSPPGPGGPEAP
jgi:phosphinothricin acetyltransferase